MRRVESKPPLAIVVFVHALAPPVGSVAVSTCAPGVDRDA